MTFWKALKLLKKGKAETVSSGIARAHQQNLETLAYWICEYSEDHEDVKEAAEYRKSLFMEFLNAKDWSVDNYDK